MACLWATRRWAELTNKVPAARRHISPSTCPPGSGLGEGGLHSSTNTWSALALYLIRTWCERAHTQGHAHQTWR